jgi:hypothetical protein
VVLRPQSGPSGKSALFERADRFFHARSVAVGLEWRQAP